jgi:hypothetical protein
VTSTSKINHPEELLDGNSTKYDSGNGFAVSVWPCEWTVTFSKTYQLRELRILFWDHDSRFFRYAIAVSHDGKKFTPLADRSKGEWKSWQVIDFPSRAVKAVKLYGLYNSANSAFTVVEFEAYCIPPAALPSNSQSLPGSPQAPRGRTH